MLFAAFCQYVIKMMMTMAFSSKCTCDDVSLFLSDIFTSNCFP